MPLSREEFCKVTGITVEQFKSRARAERKLLPVLGLSSPDARVAQERAGRARYTETEALLTVICDQLAGQGGLDLPHASAAALDSLDDLIENRAAVLDGPSFFVGGVIYRQGAGADSFLLPAEAIAGDAAAIGAQLAAPPEGLEMARIERVFLADATAACRLMRERAAAHGIDVTRVLPVLAPAGDA